MNLAEQYRVYAVKAQASQNEIKLAKAIEYIKNDALTLANNGEFELCVWLSSIHFNKNEMNPIIKKLQQEGFVCILDRKESPKYSDYDSPPVLKDVLIVSWK